MKLINNNSKEEIIISSLETLKNILSNVNNLTKKSELFTFKKYREYLNIIYPNTDFYEQLYLLKFSKHAPNCICGNKLRFKGFTTGYAEYCSVDCMRVHTRDKAKISAKQTNLKKYGVENPFQSKEIKEKIKKTNIDRYGVDNPSKSKEIKLKVKNTMISKYGCYAFNKEQAKQTNLKKYGVENPFQSKEIKEKIKKTNIDRYGVEYYSKCKEFNIKVSSTCLKRYNVAHSSMADCTKNKQENTNRLKYGSKFLNQNIDIKNKIIQTKRNIFYLSLLERNNNTVIPMFTIDNYKGNDSLNKYLWKCLYCNTEFNDSIDDGHIPRCPTCFPKVYIKEKEIVDYLKSLHINNIIENSRRIITPLELDIYLPDQKLAIEFNGTYWHSTEYKDKWYHINKTLKCKEKGIRLIHVFEYEWINNREKIKEIIINNLNNIIPNTNVVDLSQYVPMNWHIYNYKKPTFNTINKLKIFNCGYLIKK